MFHGSGFYVNALEKELCGEIFLGDGLYIGKTHQLQPEHEGKIEFLFFGELLCYQYKTLLNRLPIDYSRTRPCRVNTTTTSHQETQQGFQTKVRHEKTSI